MNRILKIKQKIDRRKLLRGEGGPGLEEGESCELSGSLGALCGLGGREEVSGDQAPQTCALDRRGH